MTAPSPPFSRALFALAALSAATACSGARPTLKQERADAIERIEAATAIAHSFAPGADDAVPHMLAAKARCVAIVPGLLHGGLFVSARAGGGVVTCLDHGAWSAPTLFSVSGASVGLAAGLQSVDVLILLMTDAGESALLEGKLRVGAQGSFAAGPVGRNAEATTDLALKAPILYYSRANGLFVGLDLSGTTFDRDEEATRALYGDSRDFGALLRGTRPAPPAVARFLNEVERAFGK
jgi:lipid-binding SYLF domain-containing protein